MNKKYNPKVGKIFWLSMAIVLIAVGSAIWFISSSGLSFHWGLLAFISPLALMTWVYFDTWYKIEGDTLIYRSAFLRGRIPIGNIKKIKTNATIWTGTKPALASNGMVLTYGRYATVYIAPEDEGAFLEDLKMLNPSILVE